ncbi:hypothetical protein C8D87_11764 [Lentzea atacamensis]|uniref:Uncharacterized protein n=1 Tax=Lentzea atacamensis TaxID=531938 RepID=A0ABX9DY47_9PSEU|nr:hypothetical protein [Lentzea atacamensis]RAS58894.1 hypothetical protein C8D87_11764 [Lentzea atacamensis]
MEERQHYSSKHLIEDVVGLLKARGLEPQRDPALRWDRSIGASRLLRGLGIADLEDHQGALDPDSSINYNRRIHGD